MKRVLFIAIVVLCSCTSFAYKYYGLKWADKSDDIVLLAVEPKNDKPFTMCKPTEDEAGKCVVMPTSELMKAMRDIAELKERNRELERRCGQ